MMVTRAPADPAAPFPTPLPIGTSDVDDIYPYIAPGPGNSAALTWTLPPPAALSPSVVQFARYDGTSWSASTSVSAPKRTASYPVVALTTDGAAGLAWFDDGLLALIIR